MSSSTTNPKRWRWSHVRDRYNVPFTAEETENNLVFASHLTGDVSTEVAIELHRCIDVAFTEEQYFAILQSVIRGCARAAVGCHGCRE